MDRTIEPRAGADRRTLLVGAVDALLVTGVVTLGAIRHETNPVTAPFEAVETVAPFVVGWLAIALLADIYDTDLASPVETVRTVIVAWLAAAFVGILLRRAVFGGGMVWPFPLVMALTGLAALLPWRVAYAVAMGRTGRSA